MSEYESYEVWCLKHQPQGPNPEVSEAFQNARLLLWSIAEDKESLSETTRKFLNQMSIGLMQYGQLTIKQYDALRKIKREIDQKKQRSAAIASASSAVRQEAVKEIQCSLCGTNGFIEAFKKDIEISRPYIFKCSCGNPKTKKMKWSEWKLYLEAYFNVQYHDAKPIHD